MPKPTQTLPYLTASSLICNTPRDRRETWKLYPCLSFLNQVLTFHPAKHLENYSYCWRNIISFSQQVRAAADNRWDFTREINSCSLPAQSSRKLPPLCGIRGNHPHKCGSSSAPTAGKKRRDLYLVWGPSLRSKSSWFFSKTMFWGFVFFFCGKILCFSRCRASLAAGWSRSHYCAVSRTCSATGRTGTRLQTKPRESRPAPVPSLCFDIPPALPWRSVGRGTLCKQLCKQLWKPSDLAKVTQKILGRDVNRRRCCPMEEKKEALVRQNTPFSHKSGSCGLVWWQGYTSDKVHVPFKMDLSKVSCKQQVVSVIN